MSTAIDFATSLDGQPILIVRLIQPHDRPEVVRVVIDIHRSAEPVVIDHNIFEYRSLTEAAQGVTLELAEWCSRTQAMIDELTSRGAERDAAPGDQPPQ